MFYKEAKKVLASIDNAENAISQFSDTPRGVIRITTPLGFGRRVMHHWFLVLLINFQGLKLECGYLIVKLTF